MTTIVLSAGGTGGHLFPAQALAAELTRRGRKIIVMTDARGTQYPTYFPGAAIEIVPAAAFSDRSKLRLMTAPFEIICRRRRGVPKIVARANRRPWWASVVIRACR
jgi:UDP-N-acetylglucosamine--N-acetylmuramyl-(pentapeptide) pyrophosphoryl-undecaprenol N-acetylglucosamine transferase